ncbi:Type IV inositol polyphosphate 5-phosphatase 9 [Linum grandiflorum]
MLRLGSSANNFVADFPSTVTTSLLPTPPPTAGCISSGDQPQDVYKLFVGSWNVGGISPPVDLDLRDWLNLDNDDVEDDAGSLSPDIYVLGFQEIVPLNAGNIIRGSTENINNNNNNNISVRWNSRIGEALNRSIGNKENDVVQSKEYECLVSKQMVGIFITVWIRKHLLRHVSQTAVSCVGCGLMGCLGNKGSVSVRFYVGKTSFCFVCSHLASGGREGDERYRNADAGEIMSRTNFRRPRGYLHNLPRKILHHDRVVWLGDLNYRIYLPETTTRFLVQKEEWNVLLEKDQLKAELRKGRVFDGWNEGSIQFAPTYKYCPNSEVYHGLDSFSPYCHPRPSKGRAPAWCDRIIWFGEGLKQSQYGRGENKLSDHRPIRAIFTAQVDKK